MTKRFWTAALLLFVLGDLAFTYWQNYQYPLDGDLVAIVWPAPWYQQVLHDPFGWAVLTRHETYSATNRFFAHATMGAYWKLVPRLLQVVVNPISSLYVASALFAAVVQGLLLWLLSLYIREGADRAQGRGGFWLAAALLVPLFQSNGFNEQIGIINRAVTYTFFYALPMVLVLMLFWPFYRAACRQQPLRLRWWQAGLLLGLMVVVAFNGPVAAASTAVVLAGIGSYWVWAQVRAGRRPWPGTLAVGWLSGQALGLLGALALLSVYSLYIGGSNNENTHDHTLGQLYELLPKGIANQVNYQQALPVLLLALLANIGLVLGLTAPSPQRRQVLRLLGWLGFFIGAYLLLLPFGGYRSYRPLLVRNDSILPVLLGLLLAYGLTAYLLLAQLRGARQGLYLTAVLAFSAFFLYADREIIQPASNNGCQRWSLDQLARAPETEVELTNRCNVLTWGPVKTPQETEYHAGLLHYWHITDRPKRYFQK